MFEVKLLVYKVAFTMCNENEYFLVTCILFQVTCMAYLYICGNEISIRIQVYSIQISSMLLNRSQQNLLYFSRSIPISSGNTC